MAGRVPGFTSFRQVEEVRGKSQSPACEVLKKPFVLALKVVHQGLKLHTSDKWKSVPWVVGFKDVEFTRGNLDNFRLPDSSHRLNPN